MRLLARTLHLDDAVDRHVEYDETIDFHDVSVEQRLPGSPVEADGAKGWAFYELSAIDPARGGAPRADVDALRLIAAFLNHWDNKPSNQRLLCPGEDEHCDHPLVMLQDTGADLGPYKLDLDGWMSHPIWAEPSSCLVNMKSLPYGGGTFAGVHVSESGRRLLADRLTQLSRTQIRTLFQAGGVDDVEGWTRAFHDRVRQLSDHLPCES